MFEVLFIGVELGEDCIVLLLGGWDVIEVVFMKGEEVLDAQFTVIFGYIVYFLFEWSTERVLKSI
jgi:hypothetical protein